MIYCIILILVIFSHKKLSVGFSSALKRNWKGIGIGIDKKELELELPFFIPKELELELELNVKELELELNWKKGIDPSPDFIRKTCEIIMKYFHVQQILPWIIVKYQSYINVNI